MSNENNFSRRTILGGATALAVAGSAKANSPKSPAEPAPEWMTLLARAAPPNQNYAPRIEGDLPRDLNGDLFRNGPGLFERGGVRKRHLLDGDGVIQRLSFRGGDAHYRSAFVRTQKFVEEEKADAYLYSTWSTRRPGGMFKNFGGGEFAVQAGVTVYPIGDALHAFDEGNPAYRLDPETLETLGPRHIGDVAGPGGLKAHAKFDPIRKEWLFMGQTFGRKFGLRAVRCAEDGTHIATTRFDETASVYIHDFMATENYFVFVMHPCEMSPFGFLLGQKSMIDSLTWRAEKSNQIILMPKNGDAPIVLEGRGAFMWHALNAYETGNTIIADFVAYDDPDHFIGASPLLATLMEGRMGAAEQPGTIRRYQIDLANRQVKEELLDGANHEFPMIDPRTALAKHRIGYFAVGGIGALQSGVKRLDYDTGAVQVHDFGPLTHVGEPVFAARPGGDLDEGWVIAQCLDGAAGVTFFAVFGADNIEAGPRAKVWLDHPMPIGFHGSWATA